MVVAVVAAVMAADNKAPSLDWDLGIWFGLAWGWQIFNFSTGPSGQGSYIRKWLKTGHFMR